MKKRYTTKAKRLALAKEITPILRLFMGPDATMTPSELHADEITFRLEGFETARGPARWVAVDVSPYGVEVHSSFGFPKFAPRDANPCSGKWNHYLWTDSVEDIQRDLALILYELRPNGRTRQNRPSMVDYWLAEQKTFAAQRAARAC